jgi:hypothetical protein
MGYQPMNEYTTVEGNTSYNNMKLNYYIRQKHYTKIPLLHTGNSEIFTG